MKVAKYTILLLLVATGCASKQCRDSCFSKIRDIQLCNDTCVQLGAPQSESNNIVLPTPDPPLLLSSTYFTFTLQWNDYSKSKYNASSVLYVLEVTRHKNSSDPAVILPFIKKYHVTNNTTFTIPQQFVTKTNFSFRLAVVATPGTSDFSPPSPLYLTNSTCERGQHILTQNVTFFPCPTFNVRVNFTATEVLFQHPRISSFVSWDYPHDIHTNLEMKILELEVRLSAHFPYSREGPCKEHGVYFHPKRIKPRHPETSETYALPLDKDNRMYFGCPYDIKLFSHYDLQETFTTLTTFYVPHCIHGFCGCDAGGETAPKRESEFVDVDVHIRESNFSVNITTANVTVKNSAWPNKIPEFFQLIIQECPNDNGCPNLLGAKRKTVLADAMKTSNSFIFHNLTYGEIHRVVILAFDKSGCLLSPVEGQHFKAITTVTTTTPGTPSPKAATTVTATTATTVTTTAPRPPSTKAVVPENTKKGLSSAEKAAITVPIVLLLLVALALILFRYHRLRRKLNRGLHATPVGLQRLADNMCSGEHDFAPSNRQNELPSPYSSDYDRPEQVKLPPKSDGGLELNPAYVEQRIQEAVEIGEADEFEIGYHRLELKRILGKGAFGKVYLADAYGIGGTEETRLVAVKVLNEKANDDEKEDFKMEINFMKTLGRHVNVVTMIGCCTLYPPLCLVVEYVPHGDLLHYLRNLRKKFEMRNRQLQGEDVEELKKEAKNTSSDTQVTGRESVADPVRYCKHPLVPSKTDTRKTETFFEPDELAKIKRTNSASFLTDPSPKPSSEPRRTSEIPQVHYVSRDPPTDVSNNTQTTLVLDTKSQMKSQPGSPSRKVDLDGALDSDELQSFALQIANGMAYLAGKGIIHRDLAARNILVGDEKVLKISDFGLSREGIYVKRSTGKIPLRWLSIEAMRERYYSTASDIWAFGIVLWEICTLGGFPYPTINDRDLLDFLLDGNRMDKPDNCTAEIYQIMLACWSRDCEDRPSFQSLCEQLFDMQKEEQPYVNVDPSQDFTLPPTAGQDTVGNLINFSNGTLSGATTDQEFPEPTIHPDHVIPPPTEIENPGYESSHTSSQDLTASGPEDDGNFFIEFSPTKEAANVTEEDPNESPV